MPTSEFDDFIQNLASLGEEKVRQNLSQGVWANRHKTWVQDWLTNLESSRTSQRAEKDLALAEEANEIARTQRKKHFNNRNIIECCCRDHRRDHPARRSSR